MHTLTDMLKSHPQAGESPFARNQPALTEAVDAAFECGQICTSCADACLAEPDVQMVLHCIRLNLDCADICITTARVLTRQTRPDRAVLTAQLQACVAACAACGAECRQHAGHHPHCGVCAESCRRCEQACQALLSGLAA